MMNPVWAASLRRHWTTVGALGLFLAFNLTHLLGFRPSAQRYEAALKKAGDMGLALRPEAAPAVLPPRVFALLTDNALPAGAALNQGNSGALTAELLGDLTRLTSKHGIDALLTEPGPVTQQPQSVQVRAHLKLRCKYPEFVAFLDDLSRGRTLLAVDRFTVTALPSGGEMIEVWVSRYILKQEQGRG